MLPFAVCEKLLKFCALLKFMYPFEIDSKSSGSDLMYGMFVERLMICQ